MNKDFLNYANSFQSVARLGLESITLLLSYLGDPHKNLKCIHVAGTNGKGSVCAFLACILEDSGLKVGKYISPNMIDVTERISINGTDISTESLEKLMDKVKIAADKVKEDLGDYPTQFELWTAAAFLYYYEQRCDICVIEVGLGGERDATNVIPSPVFSIITSVSMDHMGYLGNSLYEIACAKAGIIKQKCPVITFNQDNEIMRAIQEACQRNNCQLILANTPFTGSPDCGREVIDYQDMEALKLGICGAFQPQNASLAIEAAMLLGIPEMCIRSGLERASNMGRFEIKKSDKNRTLIIDGAHNSDGMASLMRSLERYFPNDVPVFIMGMMHDKEKDGVISNMRSSSLCPSKIYTVTVKNNSRAMSADDLSNVLNSAGLPSTSCKDIAEAILLTKDEKLCVICGSLYLYKDYHEAQGCNI